MAIKQIVEMIINQITEVGEIIGNVVKSIIPKRKSKDTPDENTTQVKDTQFDVKDTQFDVKDTQFDDVKDSSFDVKDTQFDVKEENSQSIMSKKKIIIIAAVVVVIFFGLFGSGVISINSSSPNNQIAETQGGFEYSDFTLLNDRIITLEDQMEFIVDQGIGTGGSTGIQGLTGLQGPQGIPGPQGRDGAGTSYPLMFSSGDKKTMLAKSFYMGIAGGSDDYDRIKMVVPIDGVIKNLNVRTSDNPGSNSYAVFIINGVETELSCIIIKNRCNDTSTSVKINAGDAFAIKIDKKELIINNEFIRIQASVTIEPEK